MTDWCDKRSFSPVVVFSKQRQFFSYLARLLTTIEKRKPFDVIVVFCVVATFFHRKASVSQRRVGRQKKRRRRRQKRRFASNQWQKNDKRSFDALILDYLVVNQKCWLGLFLHRQNAFLYVKIVEVCFLSLGLEKSWYRSTSCKA